MGLRTVVVVSAGVLAIWSHATAAPAAAVALAVRAPMDRVDDALSAGRIEEASQTLAASASIPSPRLDLEKAEYALATGDFAAAEAGFSALTADKDIAARAHQGLGLARLRRGATALAIVSLDSALALDPHLARALIARGVAADDAKDGIHAEAFYGRALELEPNSAMALTDRGYSRLARGRLAEAIADLRHALAIDPRMSAARTDLELALAGSGDYKGAFALSTKDTLAHDLNTVGFAAMGRGDYAVAETYFTRAMELNPQFDRTAWANLIYVKQLAHASASPGPAAP